MPSRRSVSVEPDLDPTPAPSLPDREEDGPDDLAHYARNDELAAARRQGRAVKALCGILFYPHVDPSRLPVCVVCQDLAAGYHR